jgi:hypothetical protein
MEYACGIDRSQLHSDEEHPIGEISLEPWVEVAFRIVARVLN